MTEYRKNKCVQCGTEFAPALRGPGDREVVCFGCPPMPDELERMKQIRNKERKEYSR